jgi:hypothetical protein
LRAEGKGQEALAAAEHALAAIDVFGPASQPVKVAFPQALEAALALGALDRVQLLLDQIEALPPGRLAPLLRGHALRFRARLVARQGERNGVEPAFRAAAVVFREFGLPFWLAVTEGEHAEWLAEHDRREDAEPLLREAREIFERLEARPWLERMAGYPARAGAAAPELTRSS